LMNGKSFTLLRFLVFIFLLANIGCGKEGSTELPVNSGSGGFSGGSAKYALVPSGSGCSDAVVTGSFVAGVDLGLDAELTVTVDVTTIGDWTYSTKLVNGFVFAGAGIFTATGKQTITLMAAGNPTKVGNTSFSLVMGGANCTFTVPVTATAGGGTTMAEFYYKANIEGVNYVQEATVTNGFDWFVGNLPQGTDLVVGGSISSTVTPVPAGKTDILIAKGVLHNYTTVTQAQLKTFFPIGSVSFAPADPFSGDGITILWTDPSGVRWTTGNGSTQQFGSSFKIISAEDYVDDNGDDYLKVKVQFNCKLYSTGTRAVKQVTNGEAVLLFGI
ncbi:MAG TPA: hypothetical protein VGE79_11065, partial [Niastella sp.]